MTTKLASAFGLAMLAVAFSFSTSFACPETSQTTSSAVESAVSAEASAPEGQAAELAAQAPDASAPPAIAYVDAIPVEIIETVTVVVPGQNAEEEGATITASGIAGVETSVAEESSRTAAPESEAKATPELSAQTGAVEAQIEVAEPAGVVAAVEPLATDVNALPVVVSVDAVRVEITQTVTVVVPGQTLEHNDEVEHTSSEPGHSIATPNLERDEPTAARGE
jgi:hypothetical protein